MHSKFEANLRFAGDPVSKQKHETKQAKQTPSFQKYLGSILAIMYTIYALYHVIIIISTSQARAIAISYSC